MNSDGEGLVQLVQVVSEVEATMIVSTLEAEGIEAVQVGGLTAGFRAEAPGFVQIKVHSEDLERARIALNKIKSEYAQIDWSQVDVGEPEEL